MEERGKRITRTGDFFFQIIFSRSLETTGKEIHLWQEGDSKLGKTLLFLFEGEGVWYMLGTFGEGAGRGCW